MATTPEVGSTSELYDTLSASALKERPGFVFEHPLRTRQRLLVVIDLLLIWAASAATLALRFTSLVPGWGVRRNEGIFHVKVHVVLLLLYSGLVVLFCQSRNLYRGLRAGSAWHEGWETVKAVATATIL